jgi:23S rRNA pseudouridine2605 synthase
MRLNKYLAEATGISRRKADDTVAGGRVTVNGTTAVLGQQIAENDKVTFNGRAITSALKTLTVMLNKPPGYVCSRHGQGSKTIYDLLPSNLHHLKPVGRLDKDSSGLLLLTNDGQLAYELTHPKFQKTKVYEVKIDQPLTKEHFEQITQKGVDIGDGRASQFQLQAISKKPKAKSVVKLSPDYFLPFTYYWRAKLAEGRNRQIRRTFEVLGYKVTSLHRNQFGTYSLENLRAAHYQETSPQE